MILQVPGLTGKAYVEDPASILALVVVCPLCARERGAECPLAKNGGYRRRIPLGIGYVWGWIHRVRCRACKTSFSLLPSFVVCRLAYGRPLLLAWLWACLQGALSRDRVFFEKHGILHASAGEQMAWSDLLDSESHRPGYKLLWYWASRFSRRATEAIPELMSAFVAQGCSLRLDLVESLTALPRLQERIRGLGIAAGLVRALVEASRKDGREVGLEEALSPLVDYLQSPPREASHGLPRVLDAASGYAT